MNKRIYLLLLLLLLLIQPTNAGVLSPESKQRIITTSMEHFWGNARRSDGTTVQPQSEAERTKVPIATVDANLIIEVGELSSFAARCKLDWKSNIYMLTDSARKSGLSQTQVAYVAFLHGYTMGLLDRTLSTIECDKEMYERTEARVKSLSNKSIDFAPSAQ
jgi:hypothetical protein